MYLDESVERVLYIFPDGSQRVVYKERFYPLRSPEELEKIVRVNLALKGSVHLLGGSLHSHDRKQNFKPDTFINITSKEQAENYIRLRPTWVNKIAATYLSKSKVFSIETNTPERIDKSHMRQMVALVEQSNEVLKEGLLGRFTNSKLIAFACSKDEVVACGSLKLQSAQYRKKTFDQAHSSLDPTMFTVELGYIVVAKKIRRKGLANALVVELLQNSESDNIYSTTRSTNRAMQTILICNGFICEGLPYKSPRGKYNLMLWVRRPIQAANINCGGSR